jgi:hypothetical protein
VLPSALAEGGGADGLEKQLAELRRLMTSWHPDRQRVAAEADKAIAKLQPWLDAWDQAEPARVDVDAIARWLLGRPPGSLTADWISVTPWQRAMSALERTRADQRQPAAAWSGPLAELERLLRLPPGVDSPRDLDGQHVQLLVKSMQARMPRGQRRI